METVYRRINGIDQYFFCPRKFSRNSKPLMRLIIIIVSFSFSLAIVCKSIDVVLNIFTILHDREYRALPSGLFIANGGCGTIERW